jgi:hypothetical protein
MLRKITSEAVAAIQALGITDGLIRCEDVVSAAKPKRSPLHGYFTWDDGHAAEQFRLWEARQLLSIYVEIQPATGKPMRIMVSLSRDRVNRGGGYRKLADVMSEDDLRTEFLMQLFEEVERLRQKYGQYKEAAAIFVEADKAKRKFEHAQKPAMHRVTGIAASPPS